LKQPTKINIFMLKKIKTIVVYLLTLFIIIIININNTTKKYNVSVL